MDLNKAFPSIHETPKTTDVEGRQLKVAEWLGEGHGLLNWAIESGQIGRCRKYPVWSSVVS